MYRKKRQAGRLKAPKLVQPVDLMAEKNDSSLSEESDYDDGPGFGHDDPYYQVINNSTVVSNTTLIIRSSVTVISTTSTLSRACKNLVTKFCLVYHF